MKFLITGNPRWIGLTASVRVDILYFDYEGIFIQRMLIVVFLRSAIFPFETGDNVAG
jgi:hypothetical protein